MPYNHYNVCLIKQSSIYITQMVIVEFSSPSNTTNIFNFTCYTIDTDSLLVKVNVENIQH